MTTIQNTIAEIRQLLESQGDNEYYRDFFGKRAEKL